MPWTGRACTRCATPLPGVTQDGIALVCGACQKKPPPWCAAHAPLLFEFPVNRLVHRFKFRRDTASGHALAELLCSHAGNSAADQRDILPDLWVPVPMHRFRLARRMLNPAFFLAARLSNRTGFPLSCHGLVRERHTPAQTGLPAKERKRNLRGAFRWRGRELQGVHVGLVDDVMTTGSTVSECSRVLSRAGAVRVSVWVVARAVSS